ncbi:MAG: TIGR02147 family protein [Chitinispirillaceae bacterium]|nr:TIGR02147 family protein [Chitinispirillaceae bacterium]
MERIETYTDFRLFLRDYYKDRKKRFPFFSYRYFCLKAGLKSPTIFKEVVDGKRNLTSKMLPLFNKGLDLSPMDANYFIALVHFNQSKSMEEKTRYLEQMQALKRKIPQEIVPIDQYALYSKWYLLILRELACIIPWKGDYGILAKGVNPPIKKSEAQEGMRFLIQKGFLKLREDGTYMQTSQAITSGSEVTSIGIRNFNEKMTRRGADAVHEFPQSMRDIRTMVIGISPESYPMIKHEIREFMDRVALIVDNDRSSDRVYNIGVQLFPVSNFNEKAAPDEHQD